MSRFKCRAPNPIIFASFFFLLLSAIGDNIIIQFASSADVVDSKLQLDKFVFIDPSLQEPENGHQPPNDTTSIPPPPEKHKNTTYIPPLTLQPEKIKNTTSISPLPHSPEKQKTRHRSGTKAFLRLHNKLRAKVNEGPLKWDKRLTHYARRSAAERKADCEMLHTDGPYGENIFTGDPGRNWFAEDAMRYWTNEQKDYDAAKNSCRPGKVCGHYTQMVWRSSERLGCARVRCANMGIFIQCNYDPPGNYEGDSPFQ